ncbi:MAG: hypothetical protein JRN20_01365 [Nitrososphaerota archaeon]|nr:hypothetical protein [Nitrososphaerota archaeon]MDG6921881.1 hypothetical protein [Nitrososphaerota archaeon]
MSIILLQTLTGYKSTYSELLNNSKLVDSFGGTDNLVRAIDSSIAQGLLLAEKQYNDDEGDDIELTITEFGKTYLEYSSQVGLEESDEENET